jgi:hypothetical protein
MIGFGLPNSLFILFRIWNLTVDKEGLVVSILHVINWIPKKQQFY